MLTVCSLRGLTRSVQTATLKMPRDSWQTRDDARSIQQNICGVYDFAHPGGVFDVHLRSNGRFFAPKFVAAKSSWRLSTSESSCNSCKVGPQNRLHIEWGKYGRYTLEMDKNDKLPGFAGAVDGNPEDWRKVDACPLRPHFLSNKI